MIVKRRARMLATESAPDSHSTPSSFRRRLLVSRIPGVKAGRDPLRQRFGPAYHLLLQGTSYMTMLSMACPDSERGGKSIYVEPS